MLKNALQTNYTLTSFEINSTREDIKEIKDALIENQRIQTELKHATNELYTFLLHGKTIPRDIYCELFKQRIKLISPKVTDQDIQTNFERIYKSSQNNLQERMIRTEIKRLRNNAHSFFSVGNTVKADKIDQALNNALIHSKSNVLDHQELVAALNHQRLITPFWRKDTRAQAAIHVDAPLVVL